MISVSNIENVANLVVHFIRVFGSSQGTTRMYPFIEAPSPERDSFIMTYTQAETSIQNRIVTPLRKRNI